MRPKDKSWAVKMTSKEWIHERFASLIGFSEDTSVDFILMIGILVKISMY